MHRKGRRKPIDPSESGAIAAVSATTHAAIFSPFSHKTTPVQGQDDDEECDSESESLDDDGLTSDSSVDDESGVEHDDEDGLPTLAESPGLLDQTVQTVYNAQIGLPPPPKTKSNDDKLAPKTAGLLGAKGQRTPGRQTSLPGYFDEEGSTEPGTPGTGAATPGGSRVKIPIFKRNKSRAPSKKSSRRDFNFDVGSAADVQGIVVMEIQGATDLPKLKNGMPFTVLREDC
jgi:phosphatidylserine decarboxylase